ncbi:MAG: hypothetical protein FJ125_18200, partial [Deltaproteobacteria bacterium]|nr:hypothetical protein [Deltaproteobacteria bacterium]
MVERGGSHPRGILQGLAALLCCLAACDGGGSGDGRTAPGPDAAGPPEDAATRDGGTSGQDGRVEQDGQGEPEAGAADAAGPEDGSGPTDGAAADLGFACRSTADCPGCGHCDRQQGRCVPCRCRLDEDCAHHQVCEEHDCVADCRQTGCAAEMACDEQLRRCVPRQGCRRSSECPGLSVCVEARCVAGDPYGSCDTPQVLLSGVPFAASTRRTRDHAAGSCSRQPSPEAVFTFSLDESAGVRIRVDGSADHFDPLLFLRA